LDFFSWTVYIEIRTLQGAVGLSRVSLPMMEKSCQSRVNFKNSHGLTREERGKKETRLS
jgi:hypothetical protein